VGEIGKRILVKIQESNCQQNVKDLIEELLEYETESSEGPGIKWKSDYDAIINKHAPKQGG
jgi:hypothetical protein